MSAIKTTNFSKKFSLNISLEYTIRSAVESDIDLLRWSTPDWNSYWQKKWQAKLAGELDMYVALIKDFPIARIWLDWTHSKSKEIGEISSFNVMPPFQGEGVGTQMIKTTEQIILEKGLKIAQIGIDKPNSRAQKLYEKLGYKIVREEQDSFDYLSESGEIKHYISDCWILQKHLI
jgi:ribosomal protein S18 acetylase RimI-like enzyme